MLQGNTGENGDGGQHAVNCRPALRAMAEHLTRRSVREESNRDVEFVFTDSDFVSDSLPVCRKASALRISLHRVGNRCLKPWLLIQTW